MNNTRHGTFSSSKIDVLTQLNKAKTDFSDTALKYIKQVGYEIDLGRALNAERDSRPTSWGKFVETRAFNIMGLEYKLVSDIRLFHPTIENWSGAPDLIIGEPVEVVSDVKCPFSLEVFMDKILALKAGLEVYKKKFPNDYWQLVSNAILTGANYAEAVIYVPYQSELEAIRRMAEEKDAQATNWIRYAEDCELPYLLDNGKNKNLNIFRFEVPQADKDFLTEKVKAAKAKLIPLS